eukprot:CAMPEP_0119152796 /NCGR_PEP_ID=MMETSP1310-20130426/48315_1 /TAXON_ID=464262 /ORGANISM="Genus nov. species nov., Strain RCC2339" /LENGTH=579 /DNA_ID=CAMNT_0007145201 /DNA_START=28 /DNA_END=1767 /DNA_ORIENTATION=-
MSSSAELGPAAVGVKGNPNHPLAGTEDDEAGQTTTVARQGCTCSEMPCSCATPRNKVVGLDFRLFAVSICISEIRSIRRMAGTPLCPVKLRIVTMDGVTLPDFYFVEGDVDIFFQKLHIFTVLRPCDLDGVVYSSFPKEVPAPSPRLAPSAYSDMSPSPVRSRQSDRPDGGFSVFMKAMSENVMNNLSQVTQLGRKAGGQTKTLFASEKSRSVAQTTRELQKRMEVSTELKPLETFSLDGDSKDDEDVVESFEIVQPFEPKIELDISVVRVGPLEMEEFLGYFDSHGVLSVDKKVICAKVFSGGIAPPLRPLLWKFLLGFFPWESSQEERDIIQNEKRAEYELYKGQWQSFTPDQLKGFSGFNYRVACVNKDAVRTDRGLEFFCGDGNANIETLRNILITYAIYNFDVGYCQGMNDILSPIMMVMDGHESDSFWCFKGFMDRIERNFEESQIGVQEQLKKLGEILSKVDPVFSQYLTENHLDHMFFCFRWLLIQFKREYPLDDVMRIWEVIWSNHLSGEFEIYIALATLLRQRNLVLSNQMKMDDLLRHCNDLSGQLNREEILVMAEYSCRYYFHLCEK